MTAPLVAEDLVKRFGDFVAVDGISLRVEPGETFGVLGPNGAGKSSTMRMIATVSPRTAGTLRVFGLDPDQDGRDIRARLGVLPQDDILDNELTAIENLRVFQRYFGTRWRDTHDTARRLLDFMQLGDRADKQVETLSGGMKRRLTIARALVNDPQMVLLDEPTTGLDPQARHLLWERLYRLKDQGVTLLLTTHYMDEAEQLSDRLVIMDGGHIVAEGSPAELIAGHTTREVVELRFGRNGHHDTGLEASLGEAGLRFDELPDRVLVYADDGDALISFLRDRDIAPVGSFVRRASLEDVFLALTGRSLIE